MRGPLRASRVPVGFADFPCESSAPATAGGYSGGAPATRLAAPGRSNLAIAKVCGAIRRWHPACGREPPMSWGLLVLAADLVLVGGKVWTGDPAHPEAQAVAVWRDRVLTAGTTA